MAIALSGHSLGDIMKRHIPRHSQPTRLAPQSCVAQQKPVASDRASLARRSSSSSSAEWALRSISLLADLIQSPILQESTILEDIDKDILTCISLCTRDRHILPIWREV